jgi:hypothetical protein
MTAFDYFSLFFGPIKLLTCFGFPWMFSRLTVKAKKYPFLNHNFST